MAIIVFSQSAIAASTYPSELIWHVQETPHFRIFYSDATSDYADTIARLAEPIYYQVTRELHYEPIFKTDLIVEDSADYANGSTDYVFHRISLLITPADMNELGPVSDTWMRNLITHEFTHMIHLNMRFGSGSGLRGILGPLASNSRFLPLYMIEGYAVFNERELAQGGRLDGIDYKDFIRAMAQENNFPSLVQAGSNAFVKWPGGNARYVIGATFTDYLVSRYGKAKLIELFIKFNTGQPGMIDSTFRSLYSVSLEEAYSDFIVEQRQKWVVPSNNNNLQIERLTHSGANTRNGQWLTPHSYLYFRDTQHEAPKLIQYDRLTLREEVVVDYAGQLYDYCASENLLAYSKLDYPDQFHVFSDIFLLNLQTREKRQLTVGGRYKNPVFGETSHVVYMIQNKQGKTSLWQINLLTGKLQEVLAPPIQGAYAHILYDSDQHELLIEWQQGPIYNLIALNPLSGQTRVLFSTHVPFRDASLNRDHTRIYFSVGMVDHYQLCYFDLFSRQVMLYPHLSDSVIEASVMDEAMIATRYYSSGYDLVSLNLTGQETRLINLAELSGATQAFVPLMRITSDMISETSIQDYSFPFRTLVPPVVSANYLYNPWTNFTMRYLFPILLLSTDYSYVNLVTYWNDPLDLHQFSGQYLYSGQNDSYDLTYVNDMFAPTLVSHLSKRSSVGSPTIQLAEFSANFLFLTRWLSIDKPEVHRLVLGRNMYQDDTTNLSTYLLEYQFANTEMYPFSLTYEKGLREQFMIDSDGVNNSRMVNKIDVFLPGLFQNDVLRFKGVTGINKGNQVPFRLSFFPVEPYYYKVRGMWATFQKGNTLLIGAAEYYKTLIEYNDIVLFGLFLQRLSAVFFYENSAAFDTSIDARLPYIVYGGSLEFRFDFAYQNTLSLSLGWFQNNQSKQGLLFDFSFPFL